MDSTIDNNVAKPSASSSLISSLFTVQLVSNYDPKTLEQLELIIKKIERLYTQLSIYPSNQRPYAQSESSYIDIDVVMQALKNRQQSRPINELTLKQLEITLQQWKQNLYSHKQSDTVSDFLIKRYRKSYNRLFVAMIKGEQVKPTAKETS